jgi:hypothetical protein
MCYKKLTKYGLENTGKRRANREKITQLNFNKVTLAYLFCDF